jgi:hypothetical protein
MDEALRRTAYPSLAHLVLAPAQVRATARSAACILSHSSSLCCTCTKRRRSLGLLPVGFICAAGGGSGVLVRSRPASTPVLADAFAQDSRLTFTSFFRHSRNQSIDPKRRSPCPCNAFAARKAQMPPMTTRTYDPITRDSEGGLRLSRWLRADCRAHTKREKERLYQRRACRSCHFDKTPGPRSVQRDTGRIHPRSLEHAQHVQRQCPSPCRALRRRRLRGADRSSITGAYRRPW